MKMTDHAELETFRMLMFGASSRQETRQVVRHLLAGCGRCLKRSVAAQAESGDPSTWRYDDVFDRLERWLDLELHREPIALPLAAAVGM